MILLLRTSRIRSMIKMKVDLVVCFVKMSVIPMMNIESLLIDQVILVAMAVSALVTSSASLEFSSNEMLTSFSEQ